MNKVNEYGKWLNETNWDIFGTLTYKNRVSERRNWTIMNELTNNLKSYGLAFNMFWVHERYSQPHNHFLLKGSDIELVDKLWKGKGYINDYQTYDSSKGASWYVCKYMKEDNYEYI
jgi:hypothetical protein